jgi:hypothetical protein
MLAIKTKLGSSSNSLRDYSAARGLTAPDSMLEFDAWLGGGGGGGNCTCYSISNELNENITFTYNRCSDGTVESAVARRGSVVSVCVSSGGDIYDPSGNLTTIDCGTPCSANDDCEDCF